MGRDIKHRIGSYGDISPEYAWLSRCSYEHVWQLMRIRADAIFSGNGRECIWTCEHDSVYTTGRRGRDNRKIAELPAPWVHTDRGGETTYHGPGQLMLYPVLNLRSRGLGASRFVEMLEMSCISLLEHLGVESCRRSGLPGVWGDKGKLAAVGIRIRNGISYHGMALNVSVRPHWFECIDPCGLSMPVDSIDRRVDLNMELSTLASMWTAQLIHLLS